MYLPFLWSIFTTLLLIIGCDEKFINNKESSAAKEESEPLPEVAVLKEEFPPIFKPIAPSLPFYPKGGGGHTRRKSAHHNRSARKELLYYLYIEDFIKSFIEIPTSNVSVDSSTISSKYLAGRAPIYDKKDKKVGTCSASFLCMQNQDGIYTDISNYLSINNGLILSWFTPTTLINLELDSIVNSMVTECMVLASTKIGFNPFYGETFNMIVSSDDQKIYFQLSRIDE